MTLCLNTRVFLRSLRVDYLHSHFKFSTSTRFTSGHSKWATIKHDKAKKDNTRQKLVKSYVNELVIASRLGGSDPNFNPRLQQAILRAKKGSCHKETIESAIARGQGKSASGVELKPFIEGAVLNGTNILIDCLTDNQNGLRMELRIILKQYQAIPAQVTHYFNQKGRVYFSKSAHKCFDDFVECIAKREEEFGVEGFDEDMENGIWHVDVSVSSIREMSEFVNQELGIEVFDTEVIWKPITLHDVNSEQLDLHDLVNELKEMNSIRGVYTDVNHEN